DAETKVAVVSAPAMGLRWWASAGGGAFADGREMHVSRIDEMPHVHLLYGNEEGFAAAKIDQGFAQLRKQVWRTRGFGDFWQHMLVAEGCAEVAIDPFGLKEYDLIAPALIVREAGGTFTDIAGKPAVTNGSGVSSNGLLHSAFLGAIACAAADEGV
ncbi:MAG: inositol monophosphatase family protein, partial [Acidimicrobiia bacterium]